MYVLGSPPPMRGKDTLAHAPAHVIGITPAYAGKSFRFLAQKHKRRDHPRLCGEKIAGDNGLICKEGSPPPMRGKAAANLCLFWYTGITPAYAGKSPCVGLR